MSYNMYFEFMMVLMDLQSGAATSSGRLCLPNVDFIYPSLPRNSGVVNVYYALTWRQFATTSLE